MIISGGRVSLFRGKLLILKLSLYGKNKLKNLNSPSWNGK